MNKTKTTKIYIPNGKATAYRKGLSDRLSRKATGKEQGLNHILVPARNTVAIGQKVTLWTLSSPKKQLVKAMVVDAKKIDFVLHNQRKLIVFGDAIIPVDYFARQSKLLGYVDPLDLFEKCHGRELTWVSLESLVIEIEWQKSEDFLSLVAQNAMLIKFRHTLSGDWWDSYDSLDIQLHTYLKPQQRGWKLPTLQKIVQQLVEAKFQKMGIQTVFKKMTNPKKRAVEGAII